MESLTSAAILLRVCLQLKKESWWQKWQWVAEFERAYSCNWVKITVAQTACKMPFKRFAPPGGVVYVCSLLRAS